MAAKHWCVVHSSYFFSRKGRPFSAVFRQAAVSSFDIQYFFSPLGRDCVKWDSLKYVCAFLLALLMNGPWPSTFSLYLKSIGDTKSSFSIAVLKYRVALRLGLKLMFTLFLCDKEYQVFLQGCAQCDQEIMIETNWLPLLRDLEANLA